MNIFFSPFAALPIAGIYLHICCFSFLKHQIRDCALHWQRENKTLSRIHKMSHSMSACLYRLKVACCPTASLVDRNSTWAVLGFNIRLLLAGAHLENNFDARIYKMFLRIFTHLNILKRHVMSHHVPPGEEAASSLPPSKDPPLPPCLLCFRRGKRCSLFAQPGGSGP